MWPRYWPLGIVIRHCWAEGAVSHCTTAPEVVMRLPCGQIVASMSSYTATGSGAMLAQHTRLP